jgi:hypothetical protein
MTRWTFMGREVPLTVYRELPRDIRRIIRRASAAHDATAAALREVHDRDHRPGGLPPLDVTVDEHGVPEVVGRGPNVARCVLFQSAWPWCERYAGSGTLHPGTGPCHLHGGGTRAERRRGAVVTAHAIARVLDVDPWEALTVAMRRAYAWSAWYQAKLATVQDDDDIRPGGAAYDWVRGAERTTELAAKYAKMALDAGVAERAVQQVELQGQLIAQVLSATLHELGLDDVTEVRAREIMEIQLRALDEAGRATIIPGEVVA